MDGEILITIAAQYYAQAHNHGIHLGIMTHSYVKNGVAPGPTRIITLALEFVFRLALEAITQ
jgi:hypothetical protein